VPHGELTATKWLDSIEKQKKKNQFVNLTNLWTYESSWLIPFLRTGRPCTWLRCVPRMKWKRVFCSCSQKKIRCPIAGAYLQQHRLISRQQYGLPSVRAQQRVICLRAEMTGRHSQLSVDMTQSLLCMSTEHLVLSAKVNCFVNHLKLLARDSICSKARYMLSQFPLWNVVCPYVCTSHGRSVKNGWS